MYAIKATNLIKRYKDITAVNNLNLEIKHGELFSLLGVNGAGKSTTIKMLTCIAKSSSGDALVGGYSINDQANKVKNIIALAPQETAIAPNLSVKEKTIFCSVKGQNRLMLPHFFHQCRYHIRADVGRIGNNNIIFSFICPIMV